MTLHQSTFDYLKPTEDQLEAMADLRYRFTEFSRYLDEVLPSGPDKTYIFRELRSIAMWCNVTLTRNADGSPRID